MLIGNTFYRRIRDRIRFFLMVSTLLSLSTSALNSRPTGVSRMCPVSPRCLFTGTLDPEILTRLDDALRRFRVTWLWLCVLPRWRMNVNVNVTWRYEKLPPSENERWIDQREAVTCAQKLGAGTAGSIES